MVVVGEGDERGHVQSIISSDSLAVSLLTHCSRGPAFPTACVHCWSMLSSTCLPAASFHSASPWPVWIPPFAFALRTLSWKINELFWVPYAIRMTSHKILLPKFPPNQNPVLLKSIWSIHSATCLHLPRCLKLYYFKAATEIPDQFFPHEQQVQHHAYLVSMPSACVRLLVVCHVILPIEAGIVPHVNQDLQVLTVSRAACVCLQRLKSGPQSSCFRKSTLRPFTTTACPPLLPHPSAGFGLQSLTRLFWSPPHHVTLLIGTDLLVPLLQRQSGYTEPVLSSLILHALLCSIWEHTKRFNRIHQFNRHSIWNQIIGI